MLISATSLADFKKEYPDAKVIAVDAAKMKKEVVGAGLKFDGGTIASMLCRYLDLRART